MRGEGVPLSDLRSGGDLLLIQTVGVVEEGGRFVVPGPPLARHALRGLLWVVVHVFCGMPWRVRGGHFAGVLKTPGPGVRVVGGGGSSLAVASYYACFLLGGGD